MTLHVISTSFINYQPILIKYHIIMWKKSIKFITNPTTITYYTFLKYLFLLTTKFLTINYKYSAEITMHVIRHKRITKTKLFSINIIFINKKPLLYKQVTIIFININIKSCSTNISSTWHRRFNIYQRFGHSWGSQILKYKLLAGWNWIVQVWSIEFGRSSCLQ